MITEEQVRATADSYLASNDYKIIEEDWENWVQIFVAGYRQAEQDNEIINKITVLTAKNELMRDYIEKMESILKRVPPLGNLDDDLIKKDGELINWAEELL